MTKLSSCDILRIKHLMQENRDAQYIAKKMKRTTKTVRKWIRRHQESAAAAPIRPSGRPSLMTGAARKHALELLISGKWGGSRHVAEQLVLEKATDKRVSAATVLRAAKAEAARTGDSLVCLRDRPGKWLTVANRTQRVSFAQEQRRRNWSHVMVTDRCKFLFRYPGEVVHSCRWCLKSRKHEDCAYKPNKPSAYNVYGGITRFGVTKLHPVTGTTGQASKYFNLKGQQSRNITKAEYKAVVNDTLLKEGRRIFSGQGLSSWVLQQDGDPSHGCAQACISEYNRQGRGGSVSLLPGWPGNSPDLSPIENVWSIVDREVAAKGCKTFPEFKAAIDQAFASIPLSTLRNLMDSVPERLKACIHKEGAKCGY